MVFREFIPETLLTVSGTVSGINSRNTDTDETNVTHESHFVGYHPNVFAYGLTTTPVPTGITSYNSSISSSSNAMHPNVQSLCEPFP